MAVRAKFRCLEVTKRYSHTTDPGAPTAVDHHHYRVKLAPVIANKTGSYCEENKGFYAATPSGEMVMEVVSEATAAFFEPGTAYYLDFTEADG